MGHHRSPSSSLLFADFNLNTAAGKRMEKAAIGDPSAVSQLPLLKERFIRRLVQRPGARQLGSINDLASLSDDYRGW